MKKLVFVVLAAAFVLAFGKSQALAYGYAGGQVTPAVGSSSEMSDNSDLEARVAELERQNGLRRSETRKLKNRASMGEQRLDNLGGRMITVEKAVLIHEERLSALDSPQGVFFITLVALVVTVMLGALAFLWHRNGHAPDIVRPFRARNVREHEEHFHR